MNSYDKAVEFWQRKIAEGADICQLVENRAVSFSYHSGKLENSAIEFNDTREIFEHDSVTKYTGDLRTLFEIRNSKDAMYYMLKSLSEGRKLDIPLLLDLQYELTKNTYDQRRWDKGERPGCYKKHDYVTGIDEVGALPEDVPVELGELVDEIKDFSGKKILTAGAYFHAKMENIHPFADGNGRTGRMALNYFLLSNNHPPVIIHEEDRKKYYAALEDWDRYQELSSLENFLKKQVGKTWEAYVAKDEKRKNNSFAR